MDIQSPSLQSQLPRAAKLAVQERLLRAARELASSQPLEDVTLSEVARMAKVSWPTARRYLGSKETLHALLQQENLGTVASEPGTRVRILDAAARVFSRRGYYRSTLDDVGAEAGMTKGAVYWHFANKGELFLALVRARAHQQLEGMPERIEAALATPDTRDGLVRILALHLSAVKSDPGFARLLVEFFAESRDPEIRDPLAKAYGRMHAVTADLTRDLKKHGKVSERAEPEAFAVLWSALLDGLALLSLVDPDRVDPETLAPQLVELVWNGMKRRYGGL